MTAHHTSLHEDETNPAPKMVLKQKLFTTEGKLRTYEEFH